MEKASKPEVDYLEPDLNAAPTLNATPVINIQDETFPDYAEPTWNGSTSPPIIIALNEDLPDPAYAVIEDVVIVNNNMIADENITMDINSSYALEHGENKEHLYEEIAEQIKTWYNDAYDHCPLPTEPQSPPEAE